MALGQRPWPAGHWDGARQEPFPWASGVPHRRCCPSQAVLCWGAGLWCLHPTWVSPAPAACARVGGTVRWFNSQRARVMLRGMSRSFGWSWAAQGFFEDRHVPVRVSGQCPALLPQHPSEPGLCPDCQWAPRTGAGQEGQPWQRSGNAAVGCQPGWAQGSGLSCKRHTCGMGCREHPWGCSRH